MAQNSLKDLGWYVNLSAIPDLRPGASINEIEKRALDLDLRQIAEAKAASDTKTKSTVNGPLVLQLQKTINIAVPKDQSETSVQGNSHRLLLMTLSDGSNTYQAVEMHPIRGLSMDTPPGTKLRLKGEISIWKGFLQLFPTNVDVLGGNVVKLVSAWEVSRQLGSRAAAMLTSQSQRQQTGPGGHGPPCFVPFGQRIPNRYDANSTDNFRAMDVVAKEKAQGGSGSTDDEDAVDEFSEQRQAAIAKALKDQKPRQGDDKKLAMPDISQLTIAAKPASAPPVRAAPVAPVASSGPDPEPFGRGGRPFGGGRGRRGRASYEDDYETAAAVGRPSQFRLFDVIQQQPGQEKLKLVAETAVLSASAEKPSSGGSSGRRGYDEESGGAPLGRGGHRGGHRGGRGGWRGRGGSGPGSRSSYPTTPRGGGAQPAPLFREGSAASSRGVDSASPTSDGGRGGTGNRDLPPRLKRHQQTSMSQSFIEEPGSATPLTDGSSAQQFFPMPQKSRSSTGGHMGEFGSYDADEDDEIAANARRSGGNRPAPQQIALLPTPPSQHPPSQPPPPPQMAAIYQPVVSADAYPAPVAPEGMIPYPGPGYAIQQQIFAAPPQFVTTNVASPPPAPAPAPPNGLQPQPSQPQQPTVNQGPSSTATVVNPAEWRPGIYCLARWNDGGYYPVQIMSIDPQTQTALVNYYQYSECQNVSWNALLPLPLDPNPAAMAPQPQQVLILPPTAAMQPGPTGPDLLRHQQQQQQRMMWFNPGAQPLLPPPPPFPGIESFANRLSLPPEQQFMSAAMPQMMQPPPVMLMPMGSGEQPGAEQQGDVPVETAVAAG